MSFILDALKKSETDRQQKSSPGIADVPNASRRSPTPRWIPALVALLLVTGQPRYDLGPHDAAESIHPSAPVGWMGNDSHLSPVDNPIRDFHDQQWGASNQTIDNSNNPYGYNLPRLKHDSSSPYQLHSVKF